MQENDELHKEYKSVSEVVLYSNRSIASLYRDLRKGLLQAPYRFGNRIYWKKETIDDYILKLLNKGKSNDVLGNE